MLFSIHVFIVRVFIIHFIYEYQIISILYNIYYILHITLYIFYTNSASFCPIYVEYIYIKQEHVVCRR